MSIVEIFTVVGAIAGLLVLAVLAAQSLIHRYERRAAASPEREVDALNRLSYGISHGYLASEFGPPIVVIPNEVIYATPHCLVGTTGDPSSVVEAFYITVTDATFGFNTTLLTHHWGVRLGVDTFAALPDPDKPGTGGGGGAHDWGYWETFGGFGGTLFRTYVFSHSRLGAGRIAYGPEDENDVGEIVGVTAASLAAFRAATTVNTLAAFPSDAEPREWPHHEEVLEGIQRLKANAEQVVVSHSHVDRWLDAIGGWLFRVTR